MKLFNIELSFLEEKDIFTIVLYMLFCLSITMSGYVLSIKLVSYKMGFPITSITVIEKLNPLPSNTVLPRNICFHEKTQNSCLQGGQILGDAREFKEFSKTHSVYRFIELDSLFSILIVGFFFGVFLIGTWWELMLKLLLPHLLGSK